MENVNQRARLNKLYRFQRHFYDLTRATFLFGRDEMLRQMNAQPGEGVLEIGCGTGRNLIALARLQPAAKLYGLDAADEMLKTAGAKLDARDLEKEVRLRQGLAEEFGFRETFNLDEPFDKIFISYSLSMFPLWGEALLNAFDNLKTGGELFIVDFWDGRGLPGSFVRLRTWWLGLFHVSYRPEFLEFLEKLEHEGAGKLTVSPVGRRYAFIARFEKK
jgi:S-adenosylmethionine-diacylgycerolhomoserine-N-methlytransferase